MLRGVDGGKDQSYFLWTLTQEDLSHSLFPIGHLPKSEVRQVAERAGLPNFDRKDSQGLCFLGHVDMEEFLKHYIPVEEGVVKTRGGREVGKHDGVYFYTIGQRFPLQGGEKYYVVHKDIEKNEITISTSLNTPERERSVVALEKVNWIREKPDSEKYYDAQLRYHGPKHKVKVQVNSVHFKEPTLITSGQSLVLYDPETNECLGGGIMSGNANNHKGGRDEGGI